MINIYDAPVDDQGQKYWQDISEVDVIEIYYYVNEMPIPFNKVTREVYWYAG